MTTLRLDYSRRHGWPMMWWVESQAIQAATAASSANYASFAEATRSILDLLDRHLPGDAVFLAHIDRAQGIHRIVDTRGGAAFGLQSNLARPLADSLCAHMADDRAPRICNEVPREQTYRRLTGKPGNDVGSYLGVPIELTDGSRVGSLAAIASARGRFGPDDERLLVILARVLASELERESNQRDMRRLNESLRGQARRLAALNRLARALADDGDARPVACAAAAEAAIAPVAFLLEPAGRNFVSTAMSGVEMAPITVQARASDAAAGHGAFMTSESYFVADARSNPTLAAPLVEATGARSALFEPIMRDGRVVGVLVVIWQAPVERLDEATAGVMKLLSAQAAVAIEQAGLRARVDALALSDPLTGLVTRRAFEEELPRELARARRGETPVCVAVLDLDHLNAFNLLRGEREGDRLLKETAAAWAGALRAVDFVARLDGDQFAVLLPSCGLGEAVEVIDRLRERTPRGQTSSAGVARWDGSEPADLLLMRCTDALAAAKAAGRDLTVPAD